jgi:sulfatase modifying factor 1
MCLLIRNVTRALLLVFVSWSSLSVIPDTLRASEKEFRNSVGMEFVLISAGTFTMGSPLNEPSRNSDEVQHQVTITKPFYLQTTEVTQSQWKALMGGKLFGWQQGGDMPVTKVSWHNCIRFIEKLNALQEGTYRLPAEAEWEYACRAGSTQVFTWGKTISCSQAMYGNNSRKSEDCLTYAKKRGFASDGPAPVKSYPSNAWGIYDMHGNVWEWCADWYGHYPRHAVGDPQGADSGTMKVRRGGSWFKDGWLCRSANRNFGHPASRYRTLGFRVVREVEKEGEAQLR